MRVCAAAGAHLRAPRDGDLRGGVRRLPAPVQLACGPVGRGALGAQVENASTQKDTSKAAGEGLGSRKTRGERGQPRHSAFYWFSGIFI